jgi:hypothetical protein
MAPININCNGALTCNSYALMMDVGKSINATNIKKSAEKLLKFMMRIITCLLSLSKHDLYYTDLKLGNIVEINDEYYLIDIGSICGEHNNYNCISTFVDHGIRKTQQENVISNNINTQSNYKIQQHLIFIVWYLVAQLFELQTNCVNVFGHNSKKKSNSKYVECINNISYGINSILIKYGSTLYHKFMLLLNNMSVGAINLENSYYELENILQEILTFDKTSLVHTQENQQYSPGFFQPVRTEEYHSPDYFPPVSMQDYQQYSKYYLPNPTQTNQPQYQPPVPTQTNQSQYPQYPQYPLSVPEQTNQPQYPPPVQTQTNQPQYPPPVQTQTNQPQYPPPVQTQTNQPQYPPPIQTQTNQPQYPPPVQTQTNQSSLLKENEILMEDP